MATEICDEMLQKWRHHETIAYILDRKWESMTATRQFSDGLGEGKRKMEISDELLESVANLAELELRASEKQQAKKDLGQMLAFFSQLNELDTAGVAPMSHVNDLQNVFREDAVTNGDMRAAMLANAPEARDGAFAVPRAVAP